MQSVVETPEFLADAAGAGMGEDERMELVSFVAANPAAGDLMPGTGGARKLRWRRPGTGKRGGYRVVTFYAGRDVPAFLLALYRKGETDNLTKKECNELRGVLKELADSYRPSRSA